MMRIVELVPEAEFTDLGKLKNFYVDTIIQSLSTMGYVAEHVDQSEYYSYETKIIVNTNAPGVVVDQVISDPGNRVKEAFCVLVK
ncbi:hypothetical protein [Methanocella sp. MCL-LM]|uniref:hypothetical protein n=1 Tax=Methanocella sp. MCL-LM TaxID=3412035 RepID=UPI003C73198D